MWHVLTSEDVQVSIVKICRINPLKRQAKFVAADISFTYYLFIFIEKISFGTSCEASAWQTIYMKCQDLFSLKKK